MKIINQSDPKSTEVQFDLIKFSQLSAFQAFLKSKLSEADFKTVRLSTRQRRDGLLYAFIVRDPFSQAFLDQLAALEAEFVKK